MQKNLDKSSYFWMISYVELHFIISFPFYFFCFLAFWNSTSLLILFKCFIEKNLVPHFHMLLSVVGVTSMCTRLATQRLWNPCHDLFSLLWNRLCLAHLWKHLASACCCCFDMGWPECREKLNLGFDHIGWQKSSCMILKMGGNFEQDSKESLNGGILGFESLERIKSE